MVNKLKLWYLKRRAKTHYLHHADLCDQYSCGLAMAGMVNPGINRTARKFNKVMDKIKELDSTTPSFRLEIQQ